MDPSPLPTFTINGFVADLGSETLHDRNGNALALRPQAFMVLRHLLLNSGRLVTKDELIETVWPATAVTDDSIVQCIHEIRRALNDDAHVVLKTVPRRGYRIV
ncbi:MAG: adenylate cyclase, partial [Mesorhizobium sp.]